MVRGTSASILCILALPLAACGDDTDIPPSDITDSDGSTSMGSTSLTTTTSSTTDPTTSSTSTTDDTTSSTTDDTTGSDTDGSTGSDTDGSTGSDTDGGTTGGMTASFCGDGVVDMGEVCDDGNIYDSDGCSADCQTATCLVPVTHATVQAGIDDVSCTTVFVQSGTYTENLTIDRSVIVEGQASPPTVIDGDSGGSVVTVDSGVVTLRTLRITDGLANQGGGINNDGVLTLDRTTVDTNTATGGIIPGGGGIYSSGPLTLLSSEVSGNTVSGLPTLALGGGIYMDGAPLTVTGGSLITNNSISVSGVFDPAGSGGGIYGNASTMLIIGGTVISDNTITVTGTGGGNATGEGAGICADGEFMSIANSTVSGNTIEATDPGLARARGGGITGFNAAIEVGGGTVVDGNSATATTTTDGGQARAQGGGIHIPFNSALELLGADVTGNAVDADATDGTATAVGGGVFVDVVGLTAVIGATTIADNTADANFTTSGSALASGAGLATNIQLDGSVRVLASTLSGNDATSNDRAVGGGASVMSIFNNANNIVLDVFNSTVANNTATGTNLSAGGGIGSAPDAGSATTRIASSTITGNTAASNGGGIAGFSSGGTTTYQMQNSILYDNTSAAGTDCYTDGVAGLVSGDYNVIGVVAGCDITGPVGNSTANDPGLGNLADNGGPTQTIEITMGMSADDAGNPAGCIGQDDTVIDIDQRGLTRTDCDIGSYEIQ